jgi:predicted nuclease with TOPRIM domain
MGGLGYLYEAFDEEDKEDDLDDIIDLKDKLVSFKTKTDNSQKELDKQRSKLTQLKQKREVLNEFDMYDLDSFLKKLQEFLNSQEISLHKLNTMINELKAKQESGSLLDICESLMMRRQEIELCIKRLDRTEQECERIINGGLYSATNSH